ncbi:unnamed protein product [Heligmosomoides polygyrus]|uniref:Collagen IV NC1 domain-containing protein n=1 Tax=Heligmosomoides polygyrus TaxID=6339 RepID=A0A183GT20_HELPZ|nr:unnamed protein product [Heligmosomoides polygyrus]
MVQGPVGYAVGQCISCQGGRTGPPGPPDFIRYPGGEGPQEENGYMMLPTAGLPGLPGPMGDPGEPGMYGNPGRDGRWDQSDHQGRLSIAMESKKPRLEERQQLGANEKLTLIDVVRSFKEIWDESHVSLKFSGGKCNCGAPSRRKWGECTTEFQGGVDILSLSRFFLCYLSECIAAKKKSWPFYEVMEFMDPVDEQSFMFPYYVGIGVAAELRKISELDRVVGEQWMLKIR